MFFSVTTAMNMVKTGMSDEDTGRTKDIKNAMFLALDEMSLRVKGANLLNKVVVSIPGSTREVTLKGDNNDLDSVFMIKIENDDSWDTCEYVPKKEFISEFDNPDADEGWPRKYSILETTAGFPTVRFNIPTNKTYTMTYWYYVGRTLTTMAKNTQASISAITMGTKAYFYGVESLKGREYNKKFKELCELLRANETFVPDQAHRIKMSKEDRDIRAVVNDVRKSRT